MERLRTSVLIVGGGPCGMLMSSLLSRYGIDSLLVEKGGAKPVSHPRAHVLNARSMEILRKIGLESEVHKDAPPKEDWTRFRYCETVQSILDFSSIDHSRTPEAKTILNNSACRVTQLSQPILEDILRKDAHRSLHKQSSILYDHELVDVDFAKKHATVRSLSNGSTLLVEPRVIVASDGAKSRVRERCGIAFKGRSFLESFASVHFTSPKLATFLRMRRKSAMLTFVFNPEVIAGVFVVHDARGEGNFVAHLPFFPPSETPEQFEDRTVIEPLLTGLLGEGAAFNIKSIRAWGMHANLAESFASNDGFAALVGDAAHQYPPSGGFGVNVGLSEVDDLAYRLFKLGVNPSSAVLDYAMVRRPIARASLEVALNNYERGLVPARSLGLQRLAITVASNVLDRALKPVAHMSSAWMRSAARAPILFATKNPYLVGRLRQAVEMDGTALPLYFPQVDLGADLENGTLQTPLEVDGCKVGRLVKHGYFRVQSDDPSVDGRIVASRDLCSPFFQPGPWPTKNTLFVRYSQSSRLKMVDSVEKESTRIVIVVSDLDVMDPKLALKLAADGWRQVLVARDSSASFFSCGSEDSIDAVMVDGTAFVNHVYRMKR